MGLTADTILIGLYLPPSQSVYYAGNEIDNGVCMLEHCIIDVFEEYGQLPVILFGDLIQELAIKTLRMFHCLTIYPLLKRMSVMLRSNTDESQTML